MSSHSLSQNSSPISSQTPPPTLLMIGLGRMGANMARRLAGGGAAIHGYDPAAAA